MHFSTILFLFILSALYISIGGVKITINHKKPEHSLEIHNCSDQLHVDFDIENSIPVEWVEKDCRKGPKEIDIMVFIYLK